MKQLRAVLILAVVGSFALCALTGEVAAQKGKKGKNGKVTKIDLKDGVGTITIESKKKDDPDNPVKTTFKVTKDTKYLDAPKEKGEKPTEVKADDVATKLKVGAIVSIRAVEDADDTAASIMFVAPKKE